MYQPLADKIRPKTLDDVVGQRHLLGENGLLRRVIESGSIPNLIFYGPSGVGKTTVASIIAQQTDRKLYHLNATTAGIADIKAIIDELDTFLAPNGALVYLDEIQYFNKKQQQSLLEFIETGKITLIASTTENPYFYIYTPDGREIVYHIYSAATVKDTDDVYLTGFENDEAYQSYLDMTKRIAIYDTGVEVTTADSVVTLSTCTSASDEHRFVVIGVKEQENQMGQTKN